MVSIESAKYKRYWQRHYGKRLQAIERKKFSLENPAERAVGEVPCETCPAMNICEKNDLRGGKRCNCCRCAPEECVYDTLAIPLGKYSVCRWFDEYDLPMIHGYSLDDLDIKPTE